MLVQCAAGAVLILVGLAAIRFRGAIALQRAQSRREQMRHGLLNPSRYEREQESWTSPDALRSMRWGIVATGVFLIAMGVLVVVSAVFELA